jgi:hypothetical protein
MFEAYRPKPGRLRVLEKRTVTVRLMCQDVKVHTQGRAALGLVRQDALEAARGQGRYREARPPARPPARVGAQRVSMNHCILRIRGGFGKEGLLRTWFSIGVAVFCLLTSVAVRHATGTAASCAAIKQKAAGKKALAKLNRYSKAVAKAVPVDSACLATASTNFVTAFAKTEARGGCAVVGDALGQARGSGEGVHPKER